MPRARCRVQNFKVSHYQRFRTPHRIYVGLGLKFLVRGRFEYSFKRAIRQKWECENADSGQCECCNECSCIYRHRFYCLTHEEMIVCAGYAWDGASGSAFNTRNCRRATLVHDVLYQSMREGGLRFTKHSRKWADREFLHILKEDGMFFLRRWAWYGVVRAVGWINAEPHPWVKC